MRIDYCRTCKAKVSKADTHCSNCGSAKIYFLNATEEEYSGIVANANEVVGSENAGKVSKVRVAFGSDLVKTARKVSDLASALRGVMTFLGVFTIIGGVVIGAQSIDTYDEYGDILTSYPYVQVGIILTLAGLFQILIFRLIFSYVEMQAKYREWQLNEWRHSTHL